MLGRGEGVDAALPRNLRRPQQAPIQGGGPARSRVSTQLLCGEHAEPVALVSMVRSSAPHSVRLGSPVRKRRRAGQILALLFSCRWHQPRTHKSFCTTAGMLLTSTSMKHSLLPKKPRTESGEASPSAAAASAGSPAPTACLRTLPLGSAAARRSRQGWVVPAGLSSPAALP